MTNQQCESTDGSSSPTRSTSPSINQSINIFSGLSSNATARPLWVLQLRNVTW